MSYLLLAATPSINSTKKFLIILAIIVLMIFILIGLIASGIKKAASRKAESIDLYLSDLCKYEILKTPNDVVKYVRKREKISFYKANRWVYRIFIVTAVAFVLIMHFKFGDDYASVYQILKDLTFDWHWPKGEFFGFHNFPIGWPTITKIPVIHYDFMGYLVYVELVIVIVCLIILAINIINYTAKLNRARKIKVRIFGKTVDTE